MVDVALGFVRPLHTPSASTRAVVGGAIAEVGARILGSVVQKKWVQTPSQEMRMATVGRTVSRRPDGKWANQKDGGERATSLHATQKQAADAARRNLRNEGGGELKVKDEKGKIREKDTIVPAKDPYPPKG